MIEVIVPGMLTSVQDQGRSGYRQVGVGFSGAMDDFALTVGNMLIGNPDDAAGLEVTLGGCTFRFGCDTTIALTGCDMQWMLDGRPIPPWWAVNVKAGQVLKSGMALRGLRGYIAVAGGIDVPLIMGSRSTDLKAGFGGFNGRALKAGDKLDLLPVPPVENLRQGFGIARRIQHLGSATTSPVMVRMIPAAQWDCFDQPEQHRFLNSDWKVTPQSNRLGYCLSGPVIVAQRQRELLSHGILPGCIQMPPSGQPVIQLNDANTCGGYPKLGVVIQPDLHKLAQVRPGEFIHFALCTGEEAIMARRQRLEELVALKLQAEAMRGQLNDKSARQQATGQTYRSNKRVTDATY